LARDENLGDGAGSAGNPVRYGVLLDGHPPGPAQGGDVDAQGHGAVTEQRLHQLVQQPGAVIECTVEITFLDPRIPAVRLSRSADRRPPGDIRAWHCMRGRAE
jgi:hypothetical protein